MWPVADPGRAEGGGTTHRAVVRVAYFKMENAKILAAV